MLAEGAAPGTHRGRHDLNGRMTIDLIGPGEHLFALVIGPTRAGRRTRSVMRKGAYNL